MIAAEFLDVEDLTLPAFVAGSGPSLLLLHGLFGLETARGLSERLSEDYSVVAPEHPGWGPQAPPPHLEDVRDLAELYLQLLDRLGGPVTLVGASCGAWIAAEMACLRPRDLAALVLISPVGIKLANTTERQFVDLWESAPAKVQTAMYGGPEHVPVARWSDQDFLRISLGQQGAAHYGWAPYLHHRTLGHRLGRIETPALVISGADDAFTLLPDYARRYAERIGSGAQHVIVPGAGHLVEEQRPDAIAEQIRALAGATLVTSNRAES